MGTARTLLTATTLMLGHAFALANESVCPETVNVQQRGTAPMPGWTISYNLTPPRIEMVTFFDGPPDDQASLVYDDFAKEKDSSIATWQLPRNPRGYWIKCSYSNTTLELARSLPEATASCQVTYSRAATSGQGLPVIERIACQ